MADTHTTASFSPIPSVERTAQTSIDVADTPPASATALGIPVAATGDPSGAIGTTRERLTAAGFDGAVGSTLAIAGGDGVTVVAVGVGDGAALDVNAIRNAAAAFARAAGSHAHVAFDLAGTEAVGTGAAAQAVVEGVLLARYRYDALRSTPKGTPLSAVSLVAAGVSDAAAGAERGRLFAGVTQLARDLANSPHSHLNASGLADLAVGLGPARGVEVEVFGKDELVEMGCGGLLGVNAGSTEPPRMIKLSYRPPGSAAGHLGLVGKGLMYDSGGLALKPGDEVHAQMKNDMSGAAAVFASMLALRDAGCESAVTAWLMCTDNMPSGTAMALGDVITIRGGTTVEVINTDAEGRLVMADALVLATEDGVDAIVDIATLTGACMRALGTQVAGVLGNQPALVAQLEAAAAATDEPVWELPLEWRYRRELDSTVADLRNLGGANGGAITAGLFLAEFVGDTPWAHVDIAGTAQSGGDSGWQTAGCSGFGARLLLQFALDFQAGRVMAEAIAISAPGKTRAERMLDGIEKAGNKVPHPVIMFLYLIAFVAILSTILAALDVSVTETVAVPVPTQLLQDLSEQLGGSIVAHDIVTDQTFPIPEYTLQEQTFDVQSLLSVEGIRFMLSSFVNNFAGFAVVAVTFVAMMGVGVAEKAGMMGALIRKLVAAAPAALLGFFIILVGVLSSVASDAGYLILIPLAAAAFASVGRHPLAGLAAAYAGVGCIFAVNILITPVDSMLTEITNEAIGSSGAEHLTVTANYYFSVASSILMALVAFVVTLRIVEPRLGAYNPDEGDPAYVSGSSEELDDEAAAAESKGLRYALYGLLVMVALVAVLTIPSGAPLRDPVTDDIIGNTPFMDSLIFLITLIFLICGICYGLGAKTIKSSQDVIDGVTSTFAGLAGLIFMLLMIAQFIAFFNWTNMPRVAAVELAHLLERAGWGALPLLIGLILVIILLDIIIPGVVPKWAIFAPVFIPIFARLDVAPQTVLAAYRVGDSPMNVVTPLMVYLPFIVTVAQRYDKKAGIGTIIALMLPYVLFIAVSWIILFAVWWIFKIPLGPGSPIEM